MCTKVSSIYTMCSNSEPILHQTLEEIEILPWLLSKDLKNKEAKIFVPLSSQEERTYLYRSPLARSRRSLNIVCMIFDNEMIF